MASFLNQAASFLFGSLSAKGWNYDKIKWHDLAEGRQACIDRKMPAMIVIHRTKCPACMALKPKFKNNKDIEKLSKEFIMINVEDEKENKLKEFQSDGDYVPRILFMDVDGKVLRHVKNDKSHYGKYFHAETGSIVGCMKTALVRSSKSQTSLAVPSMAHHGAPPRPPRAVTHAYTGRQVARDLRQDKGRNLARAKGDYGGLYDD